MLFVTIFMGRKSIGEMPVFDFLIVLALGSVVGADIADPSIHHLPTSFAILIIGVVQKVFSFFTIRSRWFGKLVTFEPIIVIHKGKIIYKHLRKSRYSFDNILHMLRENNIFDISAVELAIIEGNGKLSVLETIDNTGKQALTYPVIREGRIETQVLSELHLGEAWLNHQLQQSHIQIEDIFLATINDRHILHFTKYAEEDHQHLPPLHH